MIPALVTFEVLRFETVPAGAGVAVLELEGRFAGAEPDRPRLLLERGGRGGVRVELPAIEVTAGETWSATFAVPVEALAETETTYTLVPGRGPLIGLPAPSAGADREDRFVRLARTANELRHRLGEVEGLASERDRLTAELASLDRRLADAERRAADAERENAELRAELSETDAALTAAAERAAQAEAEAEAARAPEPEPEPEPLPAAMVEPEEPEAELDDDEDRDETLVLDTPPARPRTHANAWRAPAPTELTPARMLVGGAVLLLFLALVAIFLGFGVL